MERKRDKDPVVPDITHLLYRHYFIGLLHKIREKAPLPDEVESSQEGRSKSGNAKVKKGKGKPNKKHLIIKLVCDEDNNKSELLVYMRHDKYYIIAFGVLGGKTYIFSDFEGEIEGATVLPYDSSYGTMETSSFKITNIKLGYGFFREKVEMLIKQIHLGKDVKILAVQNALKPLMLTITVLLAEGGRFTILGRHPHENNLSHTTEREQPPYSDNIRHGLRTGIVEDSKIMQIIFAPTLPDLQVQCIISFCSTVLGIVVRIPCEVLKQRLQGTYSTCVIACLQLLVTN
ncbi:mitochondrial substrate carrier family protein C [Tanacetum coccineum]